MVIEAYKLVMEKVGFIVICWNPNRGSYLVGDLVERIWGSWPAPERLRVIGPGTKAQFERQLQIMKDAGYSKEPPIPRGWKFSRVGPEQNPLLVERSTVDAKPQAD
jgi:hypothetical protein